MTAHNTRLFLVHTKSNTNVFGWVALPCSSLQAVTQGPRMFSSHLMSPQFCGFKIPWASFYPIPILKGGNIENHMGGFPGGAVVKNPPANAGDTGSSPGPGRSHMPRSSWAREPQLLSLRVWSLCSATREAVIVRGPHTAMKSGPTCHNRRKPSHRN